MRRQTITTENRLTELLYFDRSDSKQIAGNSVEKQNISRRELDADFVSDFVIYAAVDYACKNVIAYFEFNGRFRAGRQRRIHFRCDAFAFHSLDKFGTYSYYVGIFGYFVFVFGEHHSCGLGIAVIEAPVGVPNLFQS